MAMSERDPARRACEWRPDPKLGCWTDALDQMTIGLHHHVGSLISKGDSPEPICERTLPTRHLSTLNFLVKLLEASVLPDQPIAWTPTPSLLLVRLHLHLTALHQTSHRLYPSRLPIPEALRARTACLIAAKAARGSYTTFDLGRLLRRAIQA